MENPLLATVRRILGVSVTRFYHRPRRGPSIRKVFDDLNGAQVSVPSHGRGSFSHMRGFARIHGKLMMGMACTNPRPLEPGRYVHVHCSLTQ
jgi:hypothetical protein